MLIILLILLSRRTPPGVRELKLPKISVRLIDAEGRTPPGVRELKLGSLGKGSPDPVVAPLPGCVN